MEVLRRELFPGVWLRTVHTHKFKSSYLSLTLMAPLSAETASANALIPAVLRRGTEAHPDLESLSAALDELYGGAIEPIVRKKGETQCVGFAASFLDDAYALEGEPVLEGAAALLGELLLRPRTENGMFYPDYVAGERSNLVDRIRAQVNDKRYYSLSRLTQLMCEGEAFGVDKLGDEGRAAALTPRKLWQRYQELLSTAEIQLYYCGSAAPDRVAEALSAALSGLPRSEERLEADCEVRLHAGAEPRLEEERMDVTQGKLALGFRTGGITCWEEASRKNLNRAVGNTTVPMSRPSATRPDSPSDRCASFRQSRTTVDVARREASRPTSSVRISGPTGTPLHSNTECSPPPCSLKRKALQRARNSSSGNASAPGPRRRAMVRNMAPVSR